MLELIAPYRVLCLSIRKSDLTMKKSINIFFALFISLVGYGCINVFKLSDLTSDNPVLNDPQKAKQLMTDMGKAHGIHMWDSISSYTAVFGDEFYGFFGKAGNPFSEEKMVLLLSYIPNTFDGRVEIMSGKDKFDVWGIQSWETYQKDENGLMVKKKNKDMGFWIPTYQYFIEFPRRIQEASAIGYVGSKVVDGINCEGVIASWNTLEKQKDTDQYVIWIDADTKRIVKLEYTVRDINHFISGKASFQNYQYFDGFLLPTEFPVESNLIKEGLLHKMSIVDFNINTIDPDELLPLD